MNSLAETRKRVFEVIEIGDPGDRASIIYDRFMMVVIVVSLLPLFYKGSILDFVPVDRAVSVIFIVDYMLRWWTADYKVKKGKLSFLLYPFTFLAIVDLVSIIPFLLASSLSVRILRMMRLTRALRTLRMLRYSKSFYMVVAVIKQERRSLIAVLWLAAGYVLLSALIMYQVEPSNFETFFDAFYWAVVTLTTVGYGDIYPVSDLGRVFSMLSSFMGIAVVALPTGIISAGFMNALSEERKKKERRRRANETQIRRALPYEGRVALELYHRIIDDMENMRFKPGWRKGVYPSAETVYHAAQRGELYMATQEDEPVGVMILNHVGNEGLRDAAWKVKADPSEVLLIHALGVHPSAAQQGVGRTMVEEAIQIARAIGQKTVRLDVMNGNLPAERLYRGTGFRFVERTTLFYPDTGWCKYDLYEYPLIVPPDEGAEEEEKGVDEIRV